MISFFNGRRRTLGEESSKVYGQIDPAFRDHLYHFRGARLAVFLAISLHTNEDGWAWPSYETLARETGYSLDTIRRMLAELCELRINGHRVLLRYQPQAEAGRFASNRYLILPTAEEIAEYEGKGVYHLGHQTGGGFDDDEPSLENPTTVNRGGEIRPHRGGKTPPQTKTNEQTPTDDDVVSILVAFNVDPIVARTLAENHGRHQVEGWIEDARKHPELRNPAGYVVSRLRSGEPAPTPTGDNGADDPYRFLEVGSEYAEFIEH